MEKISIVSRGSNLALKQVEEVMSFLPHLPHEVITIESYGDRHKEISLLDNKEDDIFTRELDEAVLQGRADVAVHSAKDLPFPLREGLEVIALLRARDRTDSLVSRGNVLLSELPSGARVGTSSLKRKEYVTQVRPDLITVAIRGTIEERLALVDTGNVDAIIVATCTLQRLGLERRHAEIVPVETHLLQGHCAVVARSGREDLKQLYAALDIRKQYGTVFLVGGGPGDPELLTIKANRLLQAAHVIVYDDLINKTMLRNYKAEMVYVGKRKGNHSTTQDEINDLLYRYATSGKHVVRLKNGDPFIFGRGGEEVTYLQERLVNVEIVPGITAAGAAAAYSEIPLTDRRSASTVAFCSAHPVEKIAVPDVDTLVYYMGASVLDVLARKIMHKGWSQATPVALINNATLPSQTVRISTLGELADNKSKFVSPLIIIVGEVVRSKRMENWFSRRRKVVVTGTQPEKYRFLGDVIHEQMITIRPVASYKEVDNIIAHIANYDWIVFPSKYAVTFFFERIVRLGKDARYVAGCSVASVGKTTTQALLVYGIVPDICCNETESARELIRLFTEENISNKRILIPRSNIALPTLPEGLDALGNEVTTVAVYRNEPPSACRQVDVDHIDRIVFSSPSCVRNFKKIQRSLPSRVECYSRGKETTRAIKEHFHNATIKKL